jgi:nucleotide-binding universal stress UspA family protein
MLTLRRGRPRDDALDFDGVRRPVMLATMEVGFDDEAATFAVDAAVECGQPLIVVNVVEIPLGPLCVGMGYGALDPAEADAASLRAPVELACSLGVTVERLRVLSPHPVAALVELALERRPSLLVFGPDPRRLKPRLYRRAARTIRARCPCLLWLAD